jgi:hypothetical protein
VFCITVHHIIIFVFSFFHPSSSVGRAADGGVFHDNAQQDIIIDTRWKRRNLITQSLLLLRVEG